MQSSIHSGDEFPSSGLQCLHAALDESASHAMFLLALVPRLSHGPRLLRAVTVLRKQLADWLLGSLSGEGNQMRWSSGPINSDKTASSLRGQRPEVGLWATCQGMSSLEDPRGSWNWQGVLPLETLSTESPEEGRMPSI